MKITKTHKIAIILVIIAAFLIIENTLVRPVTVFRYTGIQIYDAIRDFRNVEYRGFDVIVNVEGMRNNMPITAKGRIIETSTGWFIMENESVFRIVEGPMGSKDILANHIYFNVSPKVSVEAVFPPESSNNLVFKKGFRKVKGSIAFDNARIEPTLLQELRNTDNGLYSLTPSNIEVINYDNGFIIDIKVPVPVSEIEELVSRIESDRIQTGKMYYYTGAKSVEDVNDIREDLEKMGAILVNYHKQR